MDRRTLLKTCAGATAGSLLPCPPGLAGTARPWQPAPPLAPVLLAFDAAPPDGRTLLRTSLNVGPDPTLRFRIAGIGTAGANLLQHPAALASALSMRLAPDDQAPDLVILLAGPDVPPRSRAGVDATLQAAHHARQQGARLVVALLPGPAAAAGHPRADGRRADDSAAAGALPELTNGLDRLIELPAGNPGAGAPLQCIQSLIGAVAGDSLLCLGFEDAMWVLQGGGMARFGYAVASGPVQTRGAVAMRAALRQACTGHKQRRDTSNSRHRQRRTQARAQTGDVHGGALVTLKANRRTMKMADARNVLAVLNTCGAEDNVYCVTGTAYDESLRDGEVSVGVIAMRVEG